MHTIGELLERNARFYPHKEALVFEARRHTYRTLLDRVKRLADGLHRVGLRRQDRVAILAANCVEYMELLAAGDWAGFIVATLNFRLSVLPPPRSILIAPAPTTEGTLNEYAWGPPMFGLPIRLKTTRSIAFASVTVPTVERTLAPIRSWSRMIAVVRPSSESTSGRASVGMKPWTNAL